MSVGRAATVEAGFAAGSTVVVRDEEWLVHACEAIGGGWKLDCLGLSELVRETEATFYTELEDDVDPLDPAEARLERDDSPGFRRTRLWLESVLRKIALPLHESRLAVSHRLLAEDLLDQGRAVAQALSPDILRPRVLIADAVTPRHVLGQMQHELWTWFAMPLVWLDSDGIQPVRQTPPASRNPLTFFKKVIISVDTLKCGRYRAHLERHRWDAVVIDESHKLSNSATLNNKLAQVLAPNPDALILVADRTEAGSSAPPARQTSF